MTRYKHVVPILFCSRETARRPKLIKQGKRSGGVAV
jgi:hypothetical protein